jgi:hypothetical protein
MVMRVLVSGTRKPSEETRATVRRELYKLHKDSFLHLILGDASGVDAYARAWAESNGVDYTICFADWSKGKQAGILRNLRMFDEDPDLVVAFPSKESKGTRHVISHAKKLDLFCYVHEV